MEERKKASSRRSRYNSGIRGAILASAACVEQFWSEADAVLTKRRSVMSPAVFECIMYLKYNKDLSDLSDVVEANKRRKNSTKAAQRRLSKQQATVKAKVDSIHDWQSFWDGLEDVEEETGVDSDGEEASDAEMGSVASEEG